MPYQHLVTMNRQEASSVQYNSNVLSEMNRLKIRGGKPLKGTVKPDGAKNSSLYALITAIYVSEGFMTFDHVPRITDIVMTLEALNELGIQHKFVGDSLKLFGAVSQSALTETYAGKIRSSIAFLGPLLSQMGSVSLPLPGGDKIGSRPIDIHMDVVKAFGGHIYIEGGFVKATIDRPFKGQNIFLRYPSVGATINALFLAVTAEGQTEILNAAKEPEIVDLVTLLSKMGADIHGGGTNRIVVNGVKKLSATAHEIIPDRLEAGALMMCFAMTGGQGVVKGSIPEHNQPLIHLLKSVGIEVEVIR